MNMIQIECPNCHVQNRVPAEKIGQQAKCGRCGGIFTAVAPSVAHPETVTDANFAAEVLRSPLPVLVDIWAPWCGPCRMLSPVIEEIAREFRGRLKVAKLNSDENQEVPLRYEIQGIPTLLFVKNGELVDRIVGAVPKSHVVNKIQQLLR